MKRHKPLKKTKAIKNHGKYKVRTAAMERAFRAEVRERDEGCQAIAFVSWLRLYDKNEHDRLMACASCASMPNDSLEVHHIFPRSTFRELAFIAQNGVTFVRWFHLLIHRLGLVKLVQKWWLSIHPEYREVLGQNE